MVRAPPDAVTIELGRLVDMEDGMRFSGTFLSHRTSGVLSLEATSTTGDPALWWYVGSETAQWQNVRTNAGRSNVHHLPIHLFTTRDEQAEVVVVLTNGRLGLAPVKNNPVPLVVYLSQNQWNAKETQRIIF